MTVDKAFKLEKPKVSKRNHIVNPWINDEIINSVNTKNLLNIKNGQKQDLPKTQMAIECSMENLVVTGEILSIQ